MTEELTYVEIIRQIGELEKKRRELENKLRERLPEMKKRREELLSQIKATGEEEQRLRGKREPLWKELREVMRGITETGIEGEPPFRFTETDLEQVGKRVGEIVGKILVAYPKYEILVEDEGLGVVNIFFDLSIGEPVGLETLNRIADELSAEFSVPKEEFSLLPGGDTKPDVICLYFRLFGN